MMSVTRVISAENGLQMEFTVNSAMNATAEVAAANNYPNIRVTSGPEQGVDTLNLPGVFNVTHDQLFYQRLNWSVASNQSIGCVDGTCHGWDFFSAVCWFAARDLHDTLGGTTPVGAISQNYGGTSIQYWMSQDAIKLSDAPVATQCCGQNGGASCLWNTQVHPYTLGPMQLSSVIWYQVRMWTVWAMKFPGSSACPIPKIKRTPDIQHIINPPTSLSPAANAKSELSGQLSFIRCPTYYCPAGRAKCRLRRTLSARVLPHA